MKDLCYDCKFGILPDTARVPVKDGDGIKIISVKKIYCQKEGRICVRDKCDDYEHKEIVKEEEPIDCNIPIKPCPFCGKAPEVIWRDCEGDIISHGPSDITDDIGICCHNCHVTMWGDYFSEEDRKLLIERWNRRSNV